MKALKNIAVFLCSFISLILAYMLGPINKMGPVVLVDDNYVDALYFQYYFSSVFAALATCFLAYLIKVRFHVIGVSLFVSGAMWVILSQIGDPDSLQYIFGAFVEFMIPFLGISMAVMAALFGINKLWPRIE